MPVTEFVPFMDTFREVLMRAGANVLSVTVRFVGADPAPELAYAPSHESFSIVVLINVGLSDAAQADTAAMTRQLVDTALAHGGSYYLTY